MQCATHRFCWLPETPALAAPHMATVHLCFLLLLAGLCICQSFSLSLYGWPSLSTLSRYFPRMEDTGSGSSLPGCSWVFKELHRVRSVACGVRSTGWTAQPASDAFSSVVTEELEGGCHSWENGRKLCVCVGLHCGFVVKPQEDPNFKFL